MLQARRRLALGSVFAACLVAALLGPGTVAGSTTAACNPSGRAICISVTDVDNVSNTTQSFNRHTVYSTTISNSGGSTLTNVRATLQLFDVVGGNDVAATGTLVAATLPAACTPDSATKATCLLGNMPAGGQAITLGPFASKTSTNINADQRLAVTVSAKERLNDNGSSDPNPDTFTVSELTDLEPLANFSASLAFAGGSTVLDTTSGADPQSTLFFVNVPGSFTGFQLTTLRELDPTDVGYFCVPVASDRPCFGQSIAANAPGVFSSGNPAELQTTIASDSVPTKVKTTTLAVSHQYANSTIVTFTTQCSGTFGTPPPLSERPCRRVVEDKKLKQWRIDIWDNDQGNWGFS